MNAKSKNPLAVIGIVIIMLLTAEVGLAQKKTQVPPARPFEPAEELEYEAEVSRSRLRNVDVADFHFLAARRTPLVEDSNTVVAGKERRLLIS